MGGIDLIGKLVEVEGSRARIETFWGQGAHTVFKLDDGRMLTDLHKDIEAGNVQVIAEETRVHVESPKNTLRRSTVTNPLPPEDEEDE